MSDLSTPVLAVLTTAILILGYVAARSIVALADSHRLELSDKWWNPTCTECGGPLDWAMYRCRPGRHRQRTVNAVIVVATPLVFLGVSVSLASLWLIPGYLVFAYSMVLLTVTDLDTKLIPNRMLFPLTGVGAVLLTIGGLIDGELVSLGRAALGGVIYFGAMFVLALIARGALGFGDVKLAFMIGLFAGYLGWGHLGIAALGSFILGGVISLLLLATRRVGRKDSIPFGPFMTAAAIIAVIWGDAIVDFYLR
ncbi:MAG: prepilin peptidase [Acidimicrobiia bacterium]